MHVYTTQWQVSGLHAIFLVPFINFHKMENENTEQYITSVWTPEQKCAPKCEPMLPKIMLNVNAILKKKKPAFSNYLQFYYKLI